MSESDEIKSKRTQEALGSLKSLKAEPSPFLQARVLANLRHVSSKEKPTKHWLKWFWPVFTLGLGLALVFVVSMNGQKETFQVGQPYMVRFDLRSLESQSIAYAEIVVGENVRFASRKHLEIRQLEKLTFDWESLVGKQYLPVVIEGVQAGKAEVAVYFYNRAGEVVDHRRMSLRFKES